MNKIPIALIVGSLVALFTGLLPWFLCAIGLFTGVSQLALTAITGRTLTKADAEARRMIGIVSRVERSGFQSNIIKNGKCPDCGGKEWLEGPRGGMSVNIKCANEACGSKFNIGPGGYCERI